MPGMLLLQGGVRLECQGLLRLGTGTARDVDTTIHTVKTQH